MQKKFFLAFLGLLLFGVIVIASFPAPSLTQFDPAEKQVKVTYDAPFTLHFSQIMNRGSVEQAFQISPKIDGEIKWKDWRTLEFYPLKPLTIGDEYTLTIKQTARSIWMKQVGYDNTLRYVVTGPPYVLFADPINEEIITEGAITVMFDRPMDLNELSQDQLIQTEPKIEGAIRLMGLSAFQLIPKKLAAKKKYTLTIPAGLSASDGGKVKEAYSWTVFAPSLKVIKTTPAEGAFGMQATDALNISFNEEVDLSGIKPGTNVLLYPSNDLDVGAQKKMDGFFNTEVTYGTDPNGELQKDVLVFSPTFPYQPGEEYRFALKGDTDLPLEEDFELKFRTAGGTDVTEIEETIREEAPTPISKKISPVVYEEDSIFEGDSPIKFFIRGEDPKLKLKKEFSVPVELSICQIPSNEYIRVSAQSGWGSYQCKDTEPITIDPAENKTGVTLDLSQFSDLEWVTGLYFVSLNTGERKSVQWFMVEDTSLLMKHSGSDLFIWALDIKSGNPIPDMELEVLGFDGEELARGSTDEKGIFVTDYSFGDGIYVRGKKEDENQNRWGFLSDQWKLESDTDELANEERELVLILNQNVFFVGDTVQFKGIWRRKKDHVLSLPEASQVTVALEGTQENLLEPKRVPLRRNGSFDDSFEIPMNSSTGLYHLTVSDINNQRLLEPVPVMIKNSASDLKLEWVSGQSDYPSGTAPVMLVKARYQNGIAAGSVAGTYELFRKRHKISYEEGAIFYSFGLSDTVCETGCKDEEQIVKRDFVFDKNGEAKLILTDNEDGFLEEGYEYSLALSAALPNSSSASLSRTFWVHPGTYDLGLGLRHAIIEENQPIEASILCLDYDQKPVSGQQVKLSLISDGGRGETIYETAISSQSNSYALTVPAERSFDDGVYLLRAQSTDSKNNEIKAEQRLILHRNKNQAFSKGLLLAVDQKKYFVGGRGHLLINEPSASKDHPVTVVISYERDGILGYEALILSAPVTAVSVPIREVMFPRFRATVTRFNRGVPPSYSSVSQEIEVGNDAAQIFVEFKVEPAQPSAGGKITLHFLTRDYQNQPMPSVLTVNVLDGSPRLDDFSYQRFFPSTALPVSTASSLSPRNRESMAVPVIEHDVFYPDSEKSIYFNPVVATDITGKASLTFTLPEERKDLTVEVFATKNETFFGHQVSVLKLNQGLLIQPILPAFAVPGDRTLFSALVKNLSDKPVHSRIDLLSTDIAKGDFSRNISLEPGQQTETAFSVFIDPLLEKEKITVLFQSKEDSAEGEVPLRHLMSSVPVADGTPIQELWTGLVLPPSDAHAGPGSLDLTLGGGPLVVAKVRAEALDMCGPKNTYLVAARLLKNLAIMPDSPTDNDLVAVRSLLLELEKSADADGAYRFWNEPSSSPVLTAVVLWAYAEAAAQGLSIEPSIISRAAEYLWQSLDENELEPEDRFFILWVLSQNGQHDTERTLTLYRENPELSLKGKTLLLLNLDQLVRAGQGSLASLIDLLKADLADERIPDRKTTAMALFALSEVDPENPNLRSMAEILFAEKGDLLRESDSEESLWIVMALSRFSKNASAIQANFIARVKLNGTMILDQSVTKERDIFQMSVPAKILYTSKINDLSVKKEGTEPLYLDAHIISYLDPRKAPRTEEKLLILRQLYEMTDNGERMLTNTFKKGEHLFSELEFIVPKDSYYLMLSEEVPAGFRATPANSEFFSSSISEDGRVIYFASSLPAGVYKISTELEAIWPGTYVHLPAVIRPLFESDTVGRTEGGLVQVLE